MGKDVIEEFDSIVKAISKEDRIALVHDLDADGLSSAAITSHAIKLFRGKEPELVITQNHKTQMFLKETIDSFEKNKINKVIVLDFALDQHCESIEAAEKIVDQIIVIDHHTNYGCSGKKTFLIKPQLFSETEPSKYPACKLAYDLFSKHVDLNNYSWLVCVGLIGDNQWKTWKDFCEKEVEKHKTNFEELSEVSEIVSSIEVLAIEKLNELVMFLIEANSPREVVDSKFNVYEEKLEEEVSCIMKEFEERKEIFSDKDLVWFEFKTKYRLKSDVINKISNEFYPNKTVIVVQDKGTDFISFSARRQDFKVKTNELLEKAVEGLEDSGAGGHIPASAGRVKRKDFPEFKKKLFELLEN